jgi:purine-nucleoside phosphorylase
MNNKKLKQVITLLGHDIMDFDFVVLCPIPLIYNYICKNLRIKKSHESGFFRNASFEITFESIKCKGLIVLLPQGIAAQDIFFVINAPKILFIGFAGGLNDTIPIGTIVEVSNAIDESGSKHKTKPMGLFKNCNCGYSPCLLGEKAKYYQNNANKYNCEIIDMETVYCVQAAHENNLELTVWLIITDMPGKYDFWEIDKNNKSKVENSIYKLSQIISSKEFYLCNMRINPVLN